MLFVLSIDASEKSINLPPNKGFLNIAIMQIMHKMYLT